MPASYRIDTTLGLVQSVAAGRLTEEDLRLHQRGLASDPAFRPDLAQLWDASAVERVELTNRCIRELASANPFGRGARRAIAAPNDLAFGIARMFEMLRAETEDEVHVFRSMAEARAWLELPPEE